jgi:hypothetical protein
MGRPWQVFVAPPDAQSLAALPALPIPASPWHLEREARLPLEHWRLLLDFGRSLNLEDVELLASWWGTGVLRTDEIHASAEELQRVVALLASIADRLRASPPLVSEPTDGVPEDYSNEEYCRMLEAVAAVLREALRLQRPFRAWVD